MYTPPTAPLLLVNIKQDAGRSRAQPSATVLPVEEQRLRILNQGFDACQELHRLPAIDQAVIVAQGNIHHSSDDNLASTDHGTLFNLMKAKNAHLGRIQNRPRRAPV